MQGGFGVLSLLPAQPCCSMPGVASTAGLPLSRLQLKHDHNNHLWVKVQGRPQAQRSSAEYGPTLLCRVALVCSASCLLSHAALFDTSQEQLERRLLFLFLAAPAVVLGQLAPAPGQAASLKPEAAAEQAAGSS